MCAPGTAVGADFLGMPFTQLKISEACAAVRCASEGSEWRYVVTPNAAHLARLSRSDPTLLRIYANAAFCFLDSRVISLFARLVGLRAPPVVTGSDLVEQLFRREITPSTPICIVGGDSLAVAQVRRRFGIAKLSHINPSLGFWRDEEEVAWIVDFIVASRADYTFLVVGSPQQEILAARVADTSRARGVGICAGASIEFVTGRRRRAPRFIQRLALEWAYRLFMEPRRLFYRYFIESPRAVLWVLRTGLGNITPKYSSRATDQPVH